MIGSSLHILDGRLRTKVAKIKKSPAKAREVEQILIGLSGVRTVRANPTTGNVLVLFDSQRATHHTILQTLRDLNYLQSPLPSRASEPEKGVLGWISEAIVQSVFETALHRMIVALL